MNEILIAKLIISVMALVIVYCIYNTPEGPEIKIDPEKAARSRDYYYDHDKGEVIYIDYIPYEGICKFSHIKTVSAMK